MKNNHFKLRRSLIINSSIYTAGLAAGMGNSPQSEAFIGAILRFLFRGTINRAATKQTGRILSSALKSSSKRGVSPLAVLGGGSAALWGVIGAVEIKRMWEAGQIQNLLNREPDVHAFKSDESDVRIEFSSDIYQGETTPILAQTIIIPEEELKSGGGIAVDSLVLGQSILQPGETLSLTQNLPTRDMKSSRYAVVPQIINQNNPNEALDFEFGFPDGAAILQLN